MKNQYVPIAKTHTHNKQLKKEGSAVKIYEM